MKLQVALVLFSLAVAVSAAKDAPAKFEVRTPNDAIRAHEECREENSVPDDIYEQFLEYTFPDHKHTNCYIKCFVEKMGLFTVRKGFNEANIITQFVQDNQSYRSTIQHGLEKCIDHNEWESDVCTWTNRVFSCWLKLNRHIVRKSYGAV